jgi:hypothetical protein
VISARPVAKSLIIAVGDRGFFMCQLSNKDDRVDRDGSYQTAGRQGPFQEERTSTLSEEGLYA